GRATGRAVLAPVVIKVMPVALPPGRFQLSTSPALTGSLPDPNTIGIVEVARLAATAAGSPPPVVSTFTRRGRRPALEEGRIDRVPIGTRSRRSGPRQNRLRRAPRGRRRRGALIPPATARSGTR